MADAGPGGGKSDRTSAEELFFREKGTREELKIAVNVAIERFRQDEDQKEFTFPSSLTSAERAYVHRYCQKFGLKTKSRGQGSQRSLSVFKKEKEICTSTSELKISSTSLDTIDQLLNKFPVTNKEKQEVGHKKIFKGLGHDSNKNSTREGKFLLGSNPGVPPKARENDATAARMKLPIYSFREKLLKTIKSNQVTLVTGDTGCGKTTQVPQYIIEDAAKRQQPCKVICTQPRRISAISVAERVAFERGESVGQAVGFQIRLESRMSPKTSLLFCTNGVLLRMLMAGHKTLSNVSHIVIDEIHERDKFSDYLLICIRDQLKSYKNLRVLLMSAALNVGLFKEYFGGCQVIHIPAMCHDVETFFLEDVLHITGFENKAMKLLAKKSKKEQAEEKTKKLKAGIIKVLKKEDAKAISKDAPDTTNEQLSKQVSEDDGDQSSSADSGSVSDLPDMDSVSTSSIQDLSINDDESHCLEPEIQQEMDRCLKTVWVDGNEEVFDQILHFFFNENVNVDYRHSETTMTTLMIASARGFDNLVERLLELGADPLLKDGKQNWSAIDWARNYNQNHIVQIYDHFLEVHFDAADEGANESEVKVSKEDEERLELYHNTFDDDKVDHSLILCLISHICKTKQDGAILVFLPGYDDIIGIKDRLFGDKEFSKVNKYVIYMLHSMMNISNQRKVFRRPPSGVRKIILATNIAETSITIDDVVFVIDSGKIKEKTYDALTSVSALRSVWISKANALQRRGRAGRCRPGFCYHLMSGYRFHSLALYQDPEILRTPIHELCLQTKLLAAVNVSIADFLSKGVEAPPYLMIRNSVSLLKAIDALDDEEELTEMGKILVDLPIDPRLGKMLLFGIMLKCLDPILTIATSLSYREPFVLPSNIEDKRHAFAAKLKFSGLSFSDHIALSKVFKLWSRAKEEGNEASFCRKNFVSNATMEMVSGMRNQLINHLRNFGFIRHRGAGDMKDLNSNSQNWSVIKAVVLTGAYPSLLKVDRESGRIVNETEKNIRVHPSSVLSPTDGHKMTPQSLTQSIVAKLPFDWLYFDEMTCMHRAVQVKCVTALPAVAVALLAGSSLSVDEDNFRRSVDQSSYGKDAFGHELSDSENEGENKGEPLNERATLKIDDWIQFHGDDEALEMVLQLKTKLLSSFVRRVASDGRSWSHSDDAVVQCVVNVLSDEENPRAKSQSSSREKPPRKVSNGEKNDRVPSGGTTNRGSPRGRGGRGPHQRSRYEARGRNFGNEGGRSNKEDADRMRAGDEETTKEGRGKHGSFRRDRYFILKCNNYKNLEIAMSRGIWATTKSNEKKLDCAFREGSSVFLIFSIQGSGSFQGYAKMVSEVSNEICPDFGSANLGGIFAIQWVCRGDIPFQFTQDLTNPWNENKKVQISRDSQELEPSVGAALCSLWNQMEQPYHTQQPQQQQQAVPAGVEFQGEQLVTIQQAQLDPAQAYAVIDGQAQAQVFMTDGQQPGALYRPTYAPTDVQEMAHPYHAQAVYAPHHLTGFPPQQMIQPRYPPAEMFPGQPQPFLHFRRQGGYNPRSIHYYQPPY